MRRMRIYLYTSVARPDFGQVDMVDVLSVSGNNNHRDGITGFMTFDGRRFLQFVEGEATALNNLMARLQGDPRHSDIEMLVDLPIRQRLCEGWLMKRLVIAPGEGADKLLAGLPRNLPLPIQREVSAFAASRYAPRSRLSA